MTLAKDSTFIRLNEENYNGTNLVHGIPHHVDSKPEVLNAEGEAETRPNVQEKAIKRKGH